MNADVRPKQRVTVVPNVLLVPDPDTLVTRIKSQALTDEARKACPSTAASLEPMHKYALSMSSGVRDRFPRLFDELGRYTDDNQPNIVSNIRGFDREYSALISLERKDFARNLLNDGNIIDLIFHIHRRGVGGGSSIRRGAMYTREDSRGNVVTFPDWKICESLLHDLSEYIGKNIYKNPGICAIVGYVGVIHCHPFRDGNGRTSRILFNIILRMTCYSDHFLPISIISDISNGGMLIKIRRAIFGGEWSYISDFFIDAVRISNHLQLKTIP